MFSADAVEPLFQIKLIGAVPLFTVAVAVPVDEVQIALLAVAEEVKPPFPAATVALAVVIQPSASVTVTL